MCYTLRMTDDEWADLEKRVDKANTQPSGDEVVQYLVSADQNITMKEG